MLHNPSEAAQDCCGYPSRVEGVDRGESSSKLPKSVTRQHKPALTCVADGSLTALASLSTGCPGIQRSRTSQARRSTPERCSLTGRRGGHEISLRSSSRIVVALRTVTLDFWISVRAMKAPKHTSRPAPSRREGVLVSCCLARYSH